MGLDMYLKKARRVNDKVTPNEIMDIDLYFDYLHRCDDVDDPVKKAEYEACSMSDWVGVEESDVRMDLVPEYENDYSVKYYYWDDKHEYPNYGLTTEVGYWRKANCIHKWFVDNVQNGEDDCGYYEVTLPQLLELYKLCIQVLTDHSKADYILPSQRGFFFGSTDYDEWYFRGLEDTIKIISNVLSTTNFEHEIVFYHSSW